MTAIAMSTAFHTTSRVSRAPIVAEATHTTRTVQVAQRASPKTKDMFVSEYT